MNKAKHVRLSADITYDGLKQFPYLGTDMRLNVRLAAMGEGEFLPNVGMTVDDVVQYGQTGHARIDVLVDDRNFPLLEEGALLTLHDGPAKLIATGVILKWIYPVTFPL